MVFLLVHLIKDKELVFHDFSDTYFVVFGEHVLWIHEISAYHGSIFDQTSNLEILIGSPRKIRQRIAETTGGLIRHCSCLFLCFTNKPIEENV
jgi:hypothetical protein